MGVNTYEREEVGKTPTGACAGATCCCHNAKMTIAEKLHDFAQTLEQKTTNQDPQSSMAKYGKQASELLDQSAEYVRQFDYEQADAHVRAYINQSPGRSLMIAGAVGLVIGAIFRRR